MRTPAEGDEMSRSMSDYSNDHPKDSQGRDLYWAGNPYNNPPPEVCERQMRETLPPHVLAQAWHFPEMLIPFVVHMITVQTDEECIAIHGRKGTLHYDPEECEALAHALVAAVVQYRKWQKEGTLQPPTKGSRYPTSPEQR